MSTTTLPPGSSDPQIQSGSGSGGYVSNSNNNSSSTNNTNRRRNNNVPNYLQGNTINSRHSQSHSHSHHSHSSSSLWTPALYCSRLIDVSRMDIQSALDQMRSLLTVGVGGIISSICSGSGNSFSNSSSGGLIGNMGGNYSIGKLAYYRKQTKNHWARDDPAFVAIQIGMLLVASMAHAIAFKSGSILSTTIKFAFHSIVINYLLVGAVVATVTRYIANTHLIQASSSSSSSTTSASTSTSTSTSSLSSSPTSSQNTSTMHVRQSVEWMYAFDVHCNAFLPFFTILYIVQFFLLPLVLAPGFFPFLASNTIYSLAFGHYIYVTHLGYRVLPFLHRTEVFLVPVCGVVFVFLLNWIGYPFGFGWNASRIMAHLYFGDGTI